MLAVVHKRRYTNVLSSEWGGEGYMHGNRREAQCLGWKCVSLAVESYECWV